MDKHTIQPARYQVGDLVIDTGTRRISRGAAFIDLTKRSFDLLLALIESAPNLLTNEELLEKVWPDRIVGQETVTQRVKLVRDAIGDNSSKPRYIKAIWGEGYRLRATVRRLRATNADMRERAPGERFPARSIAVLPFKNMCGSTGNDLFVSGIPESVLHGLANMQGVQAIARTSSFAYGIDTTDAREIGTRLNVRYLLEGSVQQSGKSLRVIAQLIDSRNGSHIWSLERRLTVGNDFESQDEVVCSIINALEETLTSDPPTDSR